MVELGARRSRKNAAKLLCTYGPFSCRRKKTLNSLKKQLPDRGSGNLAASRTSEVTD